MDVHWLTLNVKVPEEFGCGSFAGVGHAVRSGIVFLQQLSFEVLRQLIKSCTRVGEVGISAIPRWWQRVRFKERV